MTATSRLPPAVLRPGPPALAAARRSLQASGAAWLLALLSALCFLPPLLQHTLQSLLRSVLLAAVLVTALALHWVWLGVSAARLRRPLAGWLALGVLLFPLGGATALVMLNWLATEPRPQPAPSPPRPSLG